METAATTQHLNINEQNEEQTIIQFEDIDGNTVGSLITVPLRITKLQIQQLLNQLLQNEESILYSFTLHQNSVELTTTLQDALKYLNTKTSETTLRLTFYPLSSFYVSPVTRCTASLSGHTKAVLFTSFSPDGKSLATGSGDATVRIWDLDTSTPLHTCKGHRNWVLCVSWSPDGDIIASGAMDKEIRLWNPKNGQSIGSPMIGHGNGVTCLAWQPLHLVEVLPDGKPSPKLVSGSIDNTLCIWDVLSGSLLFHLTSHTDNITQVRWSGEDEGYIYSASRDRLLKVWNPSNGSCVTNLKGHCHWVTTLTANTDFVLRTGAFDYQQSNETFSDFNAMKEAARKRYDEFIAKCGGERLFSGSDDLGSYFWAPKLSNEPLLRSRKHDKVVNQVSFSPDGRLVASASFDKTIRLWNARDGKHLAILRGHIRPVYQLCWSPDSRYLVSGSADSTVKVWDVSNRRLKADLPGHSDEVYAVDWSPDGKCVASGSKDRLLKLWKP